MHLLSQLKPKLCAQALPLQSVLMEGMTWRYLGTNLSLDCFLVLAWSKWRTELSYCVSGLSCAQCLSWGKWFKDEFTPSVSEVLIVLIWDTSGI